MKVWIKKDDIKEKLNKIKSKGFLYNITIVIAIREKLFQFIYGSRPRKGRIMMTMLNIEINNNDDVRNTTNEYHQNGAWEEFIE